MPKSLDVRRHLPSAAFVILVLIIVSALAGVFVYVGVYNVAADAPHTSFVHH